MGGGEVAKKQGRFVPARLVCREPNVLSKQEEGNA